MSNAVMSDWPSGVANTGWPQEPSGMLMPGRIQGWPAGTQRASNAAQRLLSQAVAWWDVEQYREGDRFLRNRGVAGELLDLRLGSSIAPNSNDPRWLGAEDQGYVYLPGASGNYLSVLDENALDITGDIDIRVRIAMDDWTPSATTTILSKSNVSTQNSYELHANVNGTFFFVWSTNGSTDITATSTAAPTVSDGSALWIRVTLDVNNGAGSPQYEVKFFTSSDAISWTQLGNTVTGTTGPTSIFAGTQPITIGTRGNSSRHFAGVVYRVQIWDGIEENGGTLVLDIDCDAITSGSATSFTASTSQTVNVNRSTSGRKSVCVPSRHKGGRPVMLLGTDDYLECLNNWQHGLLNFSGNDSFTILVVARHWHDPAGTAGTLISKGQSPFFGLAPGWLVEHNKGPSQIGLEFDDVSLLRVFLARVTPVYGSVRTYAVGIDRAALRAFATDVTSSVTSSTLVQGAWNSNNMMIGRNPAGTAYYSDMEFYAAAIFRRALSSDEVATVSREMTRRIA